MGLRIELFIGAKKTGRRCGLKYNKYIKVIFISSIIYSNSACNYCGLV